MYRQWNESRWPIVELDEQQRLQDRISELVQNRTYDKVEVVTECADFMRLHRGQVYRLQGRDFLIRGEMHEPRFGMPDQPKFWVKRVLDLDSGEDKIMKLAFFEEFIAHIGPLRVRCYRSPEKESDTLDLVKDDKRFMQGETLVDAGGNSVRVIDFIKGQSLYLYVFACEMSHEQYLRTRVPWLLQNVLESFTAVKMLGDYRLCHGDIRNDHIIIERNTNQWRWIDFDLKQNFSDYDLWSLGNILNFILGKGIRTFREVYETNQYPDDVRQRVNREDASLFWPYRVMNLYKIFPYIPDSLNRILGHFTVSARTLYPSADYVIGDLREALADLPPAEKIS